MSNHSLHKIPAKEKATKARKILSLLSMVSLLLASLTCFAPAKGGDDKGCVSVTVSAAMVIMAMAAAVVLKKKD